MNIGSLRKENVLRIADSFLAIAEQQNAKTILESFSPALEAYKASQFELLVVGKVKKGKSSFINALLGEPHLLPIDTHVATSTVYRVVYGDRKKYKIFFNPTVDPDAPSQFKEPQAPIETTDPEKGRRIRHRGPESRK